MFTPLRSRLLLVPLLAIVASSATAQSPAGLSGRSAKEPKYEAAEDAEDKAREIYGIAGLPSKGIVGVKLTNSLGGVVISESRGLAVVLSSSPLVLVANPTLLNFDAKKLDTLESDVQQLLLVQTRNLVNSGDGMGGMVMGGGYGGGFPMGMGNRTWVTNITEFLLNTSDVQNESLKGISAYEVSNLLFIFNISSDANFGPSSPPAMPYQRAQLTSDIGSGEDWSAFTWDEGKSPRIVANDKLADLKNAAAISPEGQVAFINDGRTYGRTEIMSAYLQAYQQFKKDSKAQNQVRPSYSDPVAVQQPFSDSFTDPAANNSPSSNQTTAVDYDQSIVIAVVAVKTANDAAAREAALKALTDILGIEFDAHRSLKASELQSLRQRLEEIEKAEAKKVENRSEILNERIRKLLGVQSVENEKPQQ